jgi:hypothetical protein
MHSEIENAREAILCLSVAENLIPIFYRLLGQGFTVKVRVGCSVQELLCQQLGLSSDYLEQRVQTIFLDGKAVDDVKTAVVRHGATLALSAAMPGLAGTTLRRGGVYAAMRNQISHDKDPACTSVKDGEIVLKLFNLVARELGPMFLEEGIRISGKNLQGFFQKAPDHFRAGCRGAELDGNPLVLESFFQREWRKEQVLLKIMT